MKLKEQNQNLRTQLRDLKVALKDTLVKVQVKKREKEEALHKSVVDSRENQLGRELDSVQRQIIQHKKEIHTLRSQLDAYHNEERLVEFC